MCCADRRQTRGRTGAHSLENESDPSSTWRGGQARDAVLSNLHLAGRVLRPRPLASSPQRRNVRASPASHTSAHATTIAFALAVIKSRRASPRIFNVRKSNLLYLQSNSFLSFSLSFDLLPSGIFDARSDLRLLAVLGEEVDDDEWLTCSFGDLLRKNCFSEACCCCSCGCGSAALLVLLTNRFSLGDEDVVLFDTEQTRSARSLAALLTAFWIDAAAVGSGDVDT